MECWHFHGMPVCRYGGKGHGAAETHGTVRRRNTRGMKVQLHECPPLMSAKLTTTMVDGESTVVAKCKNHRDPFDDWIFSVSKCCFACKCASVKRYENCCLCLACQGTPITTHDNNANHLQAAVWPRHIREENHVDRAVSCCQICINMSNRIACAMSNAALTKQKMSD